MILDTVLAFLLPPFLKAASGDEQAARRAALELLQSYGATTDADLLLAAEVIALGFAALDNLVQSVADPDLSITTRLRLRSNANSLRRASERNRQTLDKGRIAKSEPARQAPEPPPAAEPTPIQKIQDAIVQAAPALAQTLTNNGQPLSRQQRRWMARKAEEARAAQERDARRTARLAERAQKLAAASPAGVGATQQT